MRWTLPPVHFPYSEASRVSPLDIRACQWLEQSKFEGKVMLSEARSI